MTGLRAPSVTTITIVSGTWPPMGCGIAPYSRNLALRLAGRGYGVTVITDRKADCTGDGLAMVRLRDWSLRSVVAALAELRHSEPGIIHLQHPTRATRTAPAVYALPSLARRICPQHRVITTFHYLRPVDARTGILRLPSLVTAAGSHSAVVTVEHEAAYLRRVLPRKPVAVIPAGPTHDIEPIDAAARAAAREALGFGTHDFIVAYFGFLLPNKGVQTLIESLAMLPVNVKALIIGGEYAGGKGYTTELRQLARETEVSDRITWLGHVDAAEVGERLSVADCAALPFWEGASLKRTTLFAALAAGLPVITSLGPEVDCSMQDGQTLLLTPPRDPQALASAIWRLRRDASLRDRLTGDRERILLRVGWDTIVDHHEELYREVMG